MNTMHVINLNLELFLVLELVKMRIFHSYQLWLRSLCNQELLPHSSDLLQESKAEPVPRLVDFEHPERSVENYKNNRYPRHLPHEDKCYEHQLRDVSKVMEIVLLPLHNHPQHQYQQNNLAS